MASASGQVELMDAGRGAPVAPTTPRDLRHVLREDTELIDLRARNLSEREVYAIAEAIPRCAKLETVNLEWNALGKFPRAVTALLESIGLSRSVRHADLRNTGLGSVAGPALRRLLTGNRSLQSLDLRWNDLGSVGVGQVVAGLQYNPTLRRVFLAGNGGDAKVLEQADEICRRNAEEGKSVPLPPYDPHAEAKLRLAEVDAAEASSRAAKWHGTSISLEATLANANKRIGNLQSVIDAHDAGMAALTSKLQAAQAELASVRRSAAAQIEVHQAEAVRARREAQSIAEAKSAAELEAKRLEHELRAALAIAARHQRALQSELGESQRETKTARAESARALQRAEDAVASKAALEAALRADMDKLREEAAIRAEAAQEAHETALRAQRQRLSAELDRSGQLQAKLDALTQRLHDAEVEREAAVSDAKRSTAAEWQRRLDREVSGLRNALRDAESARDIAQSALASAQETHASEVKRLSQTATTYQRRAQEAEREAEQLRGALSALQSRESELEREVDSLRSSVERLHAAKQSMVAELTDLRRRVAAADADKQAALAAQRKELQAAMSRREARIVALKQQIINSRVAMNSLLADTGRRLQSLHTDTVDQIKRQVAETEGLLDLEESSAFEAMDPQVTAALLGDSTPAQRHHLSVQPSREDAVEEMRMYQRAMATQADGGSPGTSFASSPGQSPEQGQNRLGLAQHTSHKPFMTLPQLMAAGSSPTSPDTPPAAKEQARERVQLQRSHLAAPFGSDSGPDQLSSDGESFEVTDGSV